MAWLLPAPDSPTMPSNSPSETTRLIPSTAHPTPVAHEIEGENRDQDHDSGKGDDPPGAHHEFARVRQHRAPFRQRRLRPEAEEAERCRVKDRGRNPERRLHDER